jgi:hypothetical protein
MNIGALAMLLLVICGGVFGLFLVFSKMNMNAPVDTWGNTTGLQDNLTRSNVTATGTTTTYLAGWIAVIAGVMILFSIVIYFATGGRSFKSRY